MDVWQYTLCCYKVLLFQKQKLTCIEDGSRCTILWVDLAIKLLACHLFLEMAYSDDGRQLYTAWSNTSTILQTNNNNNIPNYCCIFNTSKSFASKVQWCYNLYPAIYYRNFVPLHYDISEEGKSLRN